MQKRPLGTACAVLVAASFFATTAQAEYIRRTALVEAVEKTKKGIVTINSAKRGQKGGKTNVAGTGVIIDERGYVVTNRHVVANADRIEVMLFDGTSVAASVLFLNAQNDLAVLKLAGNKKYHELRFAPGSDLMVGETVIAVGNPYGYTNSVSAGIIGALGREVEMGDITLKNLIQVTASINPGNSGGPLLNINGELIGINVAMHQGAQGISFALNADTVQQVLSKQLAALKIAGVNHGLSCREATSSKVRQQVIVDKVAAKSPAADAGLKSGDVLLKVNGREVANRFDVERALWSSKAGEKIEATVLREGKETVVAVSLEKAAGEKTASADRAEGKTVSEDVRAVNNR